VTVIYYNIYIDNIYNELIMPGDEKKDINGIVNNKIITVICSSNGSSKA